MADETLPREEWEALAAERALGVLEGEDLAQAIRLELADRTFAAEVEAWQARFAALFAEVEEVEPPAGVWQAIAERLRAEGSATAGVVRAMRRWRAGAIAATVAAACLALALLFRGPPEQVPVPVATPTATSAGAGAMAVAQLSGPEAESPTLTARYDPETAVMHISADGVAPGKEQAGELWVIPADGVPRSLGLLPGGQVTRMTVPDGDRPFMTDGSVLALTYEDEKTAPHKAPGMKPLALGTITVI